MIPLRDQEAIRERFAAELQGAVKLDLFTRRPSPVLIPGREPCPLCEPAEQIIGEIAHLADKIELRAHEQGSDLALEEKYGVASVPALVLRGAVNRPVLFHGLPAGSLLPLLIETVIGVSAPPPDMLPALKRKLKRLKRDVRLQVYLTLQSEVGIEQAMLAIVFGLASAHVRAEIIEISEFPRWAEQYGITAVPHTRIDGRLDLTGLTPPEELADQIVRASEHQAIAVRGGLLTPGAREGTAPLPRAGATPPAPSGTVRPSGLIIPGR